MFAVTRCHVVAILTGALVAAVVGARVAGTAEEQKVNSLLKEGTGTSEFLERCDPGAPGLGASPLFQQAAEPRAPETNLAKKVEGNVQEPSVIFDSRPESGVPPEALAQMTAKMSAKEKAEADALLAKGYPVKLRTLTAGTIKTVRIRYYNKETWATEEEARKYVAGFLADESLDVYGFQVWSQGVVLPEIECMVEFTDEYRKKLREEEKPYREGVLLIWNTESCFRDATGRWWFVNAFDYFHRSHPKGDRGLVKGAKAK